MGTVCPQGQSDYDGLCYPTCREGYSGLLTRCYTDCPDDMTDQGLYCSKNTFSTPGYTSMDACQSQDPHGIINGCTQHGLYWYASCGNNFYHAPAIPEACYENCPNNLINENLTCTKTYYDNGTGSVPTSQNLYYLYVILVALVVLSVLGFLMRIF